MLTLFSDSGVVEGVTNVSHFEMDEHEASHALLEFHKNRTFWSLRCASITRKEVVCAVKVVCILRTKSWQWMIGW